MFIIAAGKFALEMAVASGVGTIVGNVVTATTPRGINKIQKGLILIGSGAIGAYAGKKVGDNMNENIDEAVEAGRYIWNQFRKKEVEIEEPIAE